MAQLKEIASICAYEMRNMNLFQFHGKNCILQRSKIFFQIESSAQSLAGQGMSDNCHYGK